MRRLLIAGGITVVVLAAGPMVGGWGLGGNPRPGMLIAPAFEFSVSGLAPVKELCDVVDGGDLVGDWWCLYSDGGMLPGSTRTLAQVGTVDPGTVGICPNGSDCGTVPLQTFTTAGSLTSDTKDTLLDGGYTYGILARADSASPDAGWIIGRSSGSGIGAYTGIRWYGGTWTSWTAQTCSSSALNTGANYGFTGIDVGSSKWNLMGVSILGSEILTYLNGASSVSGSSSNCAGAITNDTWSVGTRGVNSTERANGSHRGALYTSKSLSAARWTQIGKDVFATTVSAADGTALTFSRNSTEFCSNGTYGSFIGVNIPCITGGGIQSSHPTFTQYALRTEQIENASWALVGAGGGVAPSTATPNTAIAPSGALTADTITFNATTAGQTSAIQQTVTSGAHVLSFWAKGVSGSGTLDICAATGTCTGTCSYTDTAWTRCYAALGTTTKITIGNYDVRPAQTVYLWGVNSTLNNLRPYVPATTGTSSGSVESPRFVLSGLPIIRSMEATFDAPISVSGVTNPIILMFYVSASSYFTSFIATASSNKLGCNYRVGSTTYSALSSVAVTLNARHRISCSYDGTNMYSCVDGNCLATPLSFTPDMTSGTLYLGRNVADGQELSPTGIIKDVRLSQSSTRYR